VKLALTLLLAACAAPPPAVPAPPDTCVMYQAPAKGPMEVERRTAGDKPVAVAELFIREARISGDAGFYTLADTALSCALARKPDDAAARRLQAHVWIQFHRFAEVEALAAPLAAAKDAIWLDHLLLGDARMEQGKLDGAAEAYQRAADLRPGLEVYDRVAWLRWLWGDVTGAVEMQTLAVQAGTPTDPEPFAWVLTRLGWLHALQGAPAPEIDAALRLLPDYRPALLARGRLRLAAGDSTAAADLRAVGPTVEAVWALSELDPTASVEGVKAQDPRGYAMWLTPRDPKRALEILNDEWAIRQDATTRMARAWAAQGAGDTSIDVSTEARAALATGIVEPRVLLIGARVLGDDTLRQRALAMGPGLLPSELLPPAAP
jgi:tetratricopeptide (TPR) repeat protein